MIPFTRPTFDETELRYIEHVLQSGWVTQGPKVQEFEQKFAHFVSAPFACAVSNCTTALQLALLAVGVKPGHVVVTPSHSFIATANAVRAVGAEPVFVDIAEDGDNIDAQLLNAFFEGRCEQRSDGVFFRDIRRLAVGESPLCFARDSVAAKVSAVIAVHQVGVPCDIRRIVACCRTYQIPVIEDAACAVGSSFCENGVETKIGSPISDVACFSFHPRKVLTTGEGGMLTTASEIYDKKFRLLRQHGMSLSDLARHGSGGLDIEEYVATGFNCRLSDIQAAVGLAQLEKIEHFLMERRRIANHYRRSLADMSDIALPCLGQAVSPNWQSFVIGLTGSLVSKRDDLRRKMLEAGVATRIGIMNAHEQLAYRPQKWSLPRSEARTMASLQLPISSAMSLEDAETVTTVFQNAARQLT